MAQPKQYWVKRARAYAEKYGIPPDLFLAQIQQESSFNPTARSHAGALGIAQIVPKWHPDVDPLDPEAALNYAARWMSQLREKYGNYTDALSVYNSGRPWKVGQGIGETNNYVKTILANRSQYKGGGAAPGASTGSPLLGAANSHPAAGLASSGMDASTQKRAALVDFIMKNNESIMSGRFDPIQLGSNANIYQSRLKEIEAMLAGAADPSASPAGATGPNPNIPVNSNGKPATSKADLLAWAARQAQGMGLSVREYSPYDKVDPVHTEGSFHYLGRAADISGDPAKLRAFWNWVLRNIGQKRVTEMFYDPLGGIDNGQRIDAIGGHGSHLHLAF